MSGSRSTARRPALGFALSLLALTLVFARQAPAAEAVSGHGAPIVDVDDDSGQKEAQRRFRTGVELYDDGDARAAAIEFRRAYELRPNYRILYNLGQVSYQLRDWAAAKDYFEQYVRLGAGQIAGARKHEVEDLIETLALRVGSVAISVDAVGADVFIDEIKVGQTPLKGPVTVSVGRHKIATADRSGPGDERVIDVASGETTRLSLRMATPIALVPSSPARAPSNADNLRLSGRAHARGPAERTGSTGTWLAWGGAVAVAAGGGVAAYVAVQRARDLEAYRALYPASADQLAADQRSTKTWALVADGLFVGAGLLGAVALYATFSGSRRDETERGHTSLSLSLNGLHVSGHF